MVQVQSESYGAPNKTPIEQLAEQLSMQPPAPRKLATEYGIIRTPFLMTTDEWLESPSPRYLVWSHNPSEVTWQIKERSTNEKTKSGTITHYWWDKRRQTFFDEIIIEMQLQAGNIMPIRWDADQKQPTLPEGLDDFYTFYDMVNSRKILADGRTNFRYILYNSPAFPSLTLKGKFDGEAGFPFAETAENPHSISSWTATFIVQDMTPRLGSNGLGYFRTIFEKAGFRYRTNAQVKFVPDNAVNVPEPATNQTPISPIGLTVKELIKGRLA